MRLVVFCGVAAVFCLSAGVAKAGDQDFTLSNETGYTINSVYVSGTGTTEWGDDIMGSDSLDDGSSVAISFDKGDRGCDFDLKVVYSDQTSAEWHDLDLCTISDVHLHYDKDTGDTSATTD